MDIELDIDRKTWDAALADHPAALQQDWCYGAAVEALGGRTIRALVMDSGERAALAQFTQRRIGGVVQMALCTRGPVWLRDLEPATKQAVHRALKQGLGLGRPRAVMFTPDESDPQACRGMTRVMTGYSTVMLDLDQDLASLRKQQNGKWRNRLVAAEKSDLVVEPVGSKPAQYRWLLETEEGQRSARGYRATPAQLVPAFVDAKKDRKSLLILRADLDRERVAAMMFLIHGRSATYHMGWSSEVGRKLGAHNLIFWNALPELQARGVSRLDLGGVNTGSGAGIARFKIGTGGDVITCSGTWF